MNILRFLFYFTSYALLASLVALPSCVQVPTEELSAKIQYRISTQAAKDKILNADVKISMVGDIMLGGTAEEIFVKNGYNYAFEETRHLLLDSAIAFGNLEGVLATWGISDPKKTYNFMSPPQKSAAALKYAGFDIFSIANNHILDYGVAGMYQTMRALEKEDMRHVGGGTTVKEARTPRIMEVDGHKVAFLAYSLTYPTQFWVTDEHPGVAYGNQKHVVEDIKSAKKISDLVLVSMHWGRESTTELRDYQKSIGRAAIDAGASVVMGHHPHILQAVEHYKDGIIMYSLGNFAFGSYSQKVDSSVVAQAYFKNKKLVKMQFWPIYVRNTDVLFQSKILEDEKADSVVQHLQEISKDHGTIFHNDNGSAVIFL